METPEPSAGEPPMAPAGNSPSRQPDLDEKGFADLPSKFDQLKFIRDEIKFEHSHLGQRVSWLLASNAFLLAAFAASAQQIIRDFPRVTTISLILPIYLIPLFGIVSSAMLIRAVKEAAKRITDERDLLYSKSSRLGLEPLTQLLRPGPGRTAHNLSVQYAEVMPILCCVLWSAILIAGQVILLNRIPPGPIEKTETAESQIEERTPALHGVEKENGTSTQSNAQRVDAKSSAPPSMSHEGFRNYVEAFAILGAGAALIYWYLRGSLHPGMTLKLEATRQCSSDETYDIANLNLSLCNPGRGSLALQVIEFRLMTKLGEVLKTKTYFPRRCDINKYCVTWSDHHSTNRPINLAAFDATHIGHLFDLADSAAAYIVEALVVATLPKSKNDFTNAETMQWRVSVGVLPSNRGAPGYGASTQEQPVC